MASPVLAGFRESIEADLERAFVLLKPSVSSLLIDIGSGEGHVLQYFARRAGCQCLGIERDSDLVKNTLSQVDEEIASLITICQEDASLFNFQEACSTFDDVTIYLFLSHFGYAIMGNILLRECPLGTRLVTVCNPIDTPHWKPLCAWKGHTRNYGDNDVSTLTLYLYVIDENSRRMAMANKDGKPDGDVTSHWIHPPPGSYLPRKEPSETITFGIETPVSKINDFLKHSMKQSIDHKTRNVVEAMSLSSVSTYSFPKSKPTQAPIPPPLPQT